MSPASFFIAPAKENNYIIPKAFECKSFHIFIRFFTINTYIVVCRSGNRSTQASVILINNKFTNINNMIGGMNNWSFEIEN
jgi:hypothetical protein